MTNQEYADSLRLVADFYATHEDVPQPDSVLKVFALFGRAAVAAFARALGHVEKEVDDHFYRVSRKFGGITLQGLDLRERVCERVQVGEKTQIVRVPVSEPAYEEREEIVPIYEYHCPDSLLEG